MTLQAHITVVRDAFTLDATLEVGPGEVLAVLGPNGAGKTTLLRALAGLPLVHRGFVALNGRTLDDAAQGHRTPPQDRRMGVVFQDYRLFPHLSALENVAFGLRSTGTAKAAARADAREWLLRLGLEGYELRRPAELSGGQGQRVALARALCARPDLLLLDEPLAALDVDTRDSVRAALRRQLTSFAGPSVLVTHDPVEALTLADRLLILEGGRVVQDGPVELVARRPATPYVASVVGLNLLQGTARPGAVALSGGGQLITADSVLAGPALAAIPPSAVQLHRDQPVGTTARNIWQGQLTSLEALGGRVRAVVQGQPTLLADVTTQAVAELHMAVGDRVWVSVKATEVDVYGA